MSIRSFARALAAAPDLSAPLRLALRQIPALLLATALVVALSGRLAEADPAAIARALGSLSAPRWLGALLLAGLSFWAVGRYDALVHRHLATGRGAAEAGRAGLLAIALGQTTGFGLLTGALVRWRMLPGVSLAAAVGITLAVTLLFLAGWAVLAAAAVLALPSPALAPVRPVAWASIAALPGALALCLLQPRLRILGRAVRLPTLPTLTRLVALAAVDTAAAALCLAELLPAEAGVGFGQLLPAFILAYGAGLVSGAPGGMGAFEVALLAALPAADPEALLAGVLAWRRAIYCALPALLALALLARGPAPAPRGTPLPEPVRVSEPLPSGVAELVGSSRRAEAGLLRQGDKLFLPVPGRRAGGLVLGRTGQFLAAIGDPLGAADPEQAGIMLTAAAEAEGRLPCLYKAGARSALAARRAGWQVAPVALEVWLRPAAFRLDAPERRQLRRKLRKAQAADVAIARATGALPLAEMAAVAEAWARSRDGERGFSMGRFAPDYVAAQRVYLARIGGLLVAFLTLHEGAAEWTLDLMRASPDAPDGAMHALLALAIAEAAAEGCPRLSLAALPHPRTEALARYLPRALRPGTGSEGLGQFKRAFAPAFEPLYLAAPSRIALVLAAFDLARAIDRPAPLPAAAKACPTHRAA
jgi:phosphatidylglycerol lysyltransferase